MLVFVANISKKFELEETLITKHLRLQFSVRARV